MHYARVKSYAKINLSLDVAGVSGGYHMIDSVVVSVDLADLITASKRKDNLVNVYMHGEGSESIPPECNNALKAGDRFVQKFGVCGADINIYKNIPIGAGLGGSSADISGVIRVMAKLYNVGDLAALKALADELGSDTGYMLYGGYARLGGRGERIKPIPSGLKLHIGLLVPKQGVSTAECYRLCDTFARPAPASDNAERAILSGDVRLLGKSLSNGLYAAACGICGDVKEAYSSLAAFDPLGVNMTGSGSGVYALFENEEFLSYAKSRYAGQFRFIPLKTVLPSPHKSARKCKGVVNGEED